MPPKPDTSKSATRKSDRTSKKTAKVAENEKISKKNEQSDRIDTESDTDSDSEDAQLVANQTLTISAMKNMLDEALERQEKSIKLSITDAVAPAIAPLQNEVTEMKKKIGEKDVEMNKMMIQLNDLEQHNRRDSLRIEGIQEDIDDSTNSSVIRIAQDYLGVEVK